VVGRASRLRIEVRDHQRPRRFSSCRGPLGPLLVGTARATAPLAGQVLAGHPPSYQDAALLGCPSGPKLGTCRRWYWSQIWSPIPSKQVKNMRLSETLRKRAPQMTCTDVIMKTVVLQRNTTHNPEVAGSNPVPATKTPGQRKFPLAWFCLW
jgi:hypothetical protein